MPSKVRITGHVAPNDSRYCGSFYVYVALRSHLLVFIADASTPASEVRLASSGLVESRQHRFFILKDCY